uniref:Protein quiver n=1 Tax=Heligmosomoides polygyrus TaxID=6339 RepID=A0A183FEU6_HELPZ
LLSLQLAHVWCITCYECNSSQGQECKYTATSCQYGFFGCVKIAAYSGGVDKMGMWYDQDRRIASAFLLCSVSINLQHFSLGADMCEQTSILGIRVIKCVCFNDYCNSSATLSQFACLLVIIVSLLFSNSLL